MIVSSRLHYNGDEVDPRVATVCFDTVTMLEGITSLESLVIKSDGISPDAYCATLHRD